VSGPVHFLSVILSLLLLEMCTGLKIPAQPTRFVHFYGLAHPGLAGEEWPTLKDDGSHIVQPGPLSRAVNGSASVPVSWHPGMF